MADPYQTLGVKKTATEDEIRKAYKKLAKKHHPDLNPGDKAAEDQFKDISAAYTFLNDPEKRRAFDAVRSTSRASPSQSAGSIASTPMPEQAPATSAPRIWAILATSLGIFSASEPAAEKALARSSECVAPT